MYRLLLVTDRKEIQSLYNNYRDWNLQGFASPVITDSVNSGLELISNEHFDIVSWLLPVQAGQLFSSRVKYKSILGIETATNLLQLQRELRNARHELISKEIAASADTQKHLNQREMIKSILKGDGLEVSNSAQLSMLKANGIHIDNHVAVSSFRIPEGESFETNSWKYGPQRFEYALCNVFESSNDDVQYVLSIINAHHMHLLGYPSSQMNEKELFIKMAQHLTHCRNLLHGYFDMSLNLRWSYVYSDFKTLLIDLDKRSIQ